MTVLVVTGHPPWPELSGGRRREAELLQRLAKRADVEVCAVDKLASAKNSRTLLDAPVSGRVFGTLPSNGSSELEARHRSPGAQDWIAERLSRGDVSLVHCEGFFLQQLLPASPGAALVIGTQNVEWELVEQQLRLGCAAQDDATAAVVADRQRRELAVLGAADAVVCVTDRDAALLRRHGLAPIVVPDGCDHLAVGEDVAEPVDVLVPGNFAYEPNRDAALAFDADLLPYIRARRPGTTVRFVGNGARSELAHLIRPGVEVVGPVESLAPHLASTSVVVVPLRIGGGIKVKVLEALFAGSAIVCTPIGATGFEDHDGALVVADLATEFLPAVLNLLGRPEQLAAQRERAAVYAATLPRWDEAADRLDTVWQSVSANMAEEMMTR